jgi:saccharopine dehydrogenase-like NADP-dependent oxidoreductase
MHRVLVLGGGLVGSVIARDLSKDSGIEVTVVDNNKKRIQQIKDSSKVQDLLLDLSKEGAVSKIAQDFDLVIGAVPGFLGFKVVKEAIEAHKNVVDISFSERDYFELDDLAKEKEVTVVFDCGVAPGMSNILAYALARELDETESIKIFVGGLPQTRFWPYEYKIVFSPYDVIEEYTRPTRIVENGKIVIKEALSDVELIDVEGVGTLEAFNTDGLRSLLKTLNVPNMVEKTLRFLGHAEKMKILRYTGFFGKEPVDVNGQKIAPLDVTAKLLFPILELREGEKDFTVMKVEAKGKKYNKKIALSYFLVDYYDEETRTTSMVRTTGFPAAIVSRMILKGEFNYKGVYPPEYIANHESLFGMLLKELEKRKVRFLKEERVL